MLIRWTRPEVTGSEGFYYDIYYSDSNNPETFSKQNERSFVSAQHHVEYLLRGMKVQTDYTIRVVVRNEVSDQDDENEHSRLCEANVTTRDVLRKFTYMRYVCITAINIRKGKCTCKLLKTCTNVHSCSIWYNARAHSTCTHTRTHSWSSTGSTCTLQYHCLETTCCFF